MRRTTRKAVKDSREEEDSANGYEADKAEMEEVFLSIFVILSNLNSDHHPIERNLAV